MPGGQAPAAGFLGTSAQTLSHNVHVDTVDRKVKTLDSPDTATCVNRMVKLWP